MRAAATPAVKPYPVLLHTLTSLRYLAAVWVVFFHFKEFFPQSGLDGLAPLRLGYLGVDFFFVLSGFVLAHVYLEKVATRRFDFWSFAVRRLARIYPMHVLSLLLTIVLGVVAARAGWQFTIWDPTRFLDISRGEALRALFANLTLIHAWGATKGLLFNLPSWSISAEWFAYLLFPAVVLVVGHRRVSPGLAVVASVLFLIVLATAYHLLIGRSLFLSSWNLGVLRILPEFTLGVALRRWGGVFSLGPRLALPAFLAACALLVVLLLVRASPLAITLTLAALVLLAADAERHGGLRALGRPFPVLLGEVSYSLYLLHLPVGIYLFDVLLRNTHGAGLLLATAWISAAIAGITVASWLSHRFFEIPARELLIAAGRGAAPLLAPRQDDRPPPNAR